MIVRRKTWLYRTHESLVAKRIVFGLPVSKKYVEEYVLQQFKKIVVEIWANDTH